MESLTQHPQNVRGIERRDVRAETRANAHAAIDEKHRHDRQIVLRLHDHTVIIEMLENTGILLAEELVRDALQIGEDVSRRSGILTAHQPRTKLPIWHKQIDVIRSDKVLSHAHNRATERCLAVVVSGML